MPRDERGDSVTPWVADALGVLGLLVMTLGVVGMFRFPDTYGRLHAASKAVPLGVASLVVAGALLGGAGNSGRSLLVAAFLLLTAPVSSHAIGRAARRAGEPMSGPRIVDESRTAPLSSDDRGPGPSCRPK